jgi:hypothetical protein
MPIKSLKNLLNANDDGDLGDIVKHARDMGALVQTLLRALPSDHVASIAAANIRRDGKLVILAASSAWASRLRFETDALIDAARKTGADVTSCSVRVARV